MDNKTDKKTKTQKPAKKSIKEKEQKLVNNTPKTIKKIKADKPKKDEKIKIKKDDKKPRKKLESRLTQKQAIFAKEYIKTGNATQSALKAGYSEKTAQAQGSRLLTNVMVASEISRLNEKKEKKAIMDAQEVMELFSAIARGEVKDQFGLDATLSDRLKAMNEIAKRTVDIDNRIKGVPDNSIMIKVDWKKTVKEVRDENS